MYYVGHTRYDEDPKTKIGAGSEGAVYPFPGNSALCVKIFHPPDPGDRAGAGIAEYRARKVASICGMGLSLAPQFVLPQKPVCDARGNVIGFLMRRVPLGFHKLMKLLDPGFRASNQIYLKEVAEFVARIFEGLTLLHAQKLAVGDVNMGFMLITSALECAWVDADSWSYPGFPCLATTELFAHPELYSNLRQGQKFVAPQPHHDRFAITVLATMMLLPGAHPFRMGSHPSVHSLAERAEKGITIFDKEVTYPKMFARPETLSDELLQLLDDRLKRKTNDPLKPEDLRGFAAAVIQCKSCNAHYHGSRKHCPACQTKTVIDMTVMVELLIQQLFKAPGQLLYAQVQGDALRLVCRVQNKLQIITVSSQGAPSIINTKLTAPRGARYRFFADCLAICATPDAEAPVAVQLYRLDGGTATRLADTSTMVLEGDTAVFDTSYRYLYRVAGNSLMCCSLFGAGTLTNTPVTSVYQSQTWFTVDRMSGADREVIFGYHRALRDWEWFVVHGQADGKRFSNNKVDTLPLRPRERLEDFKVYFNTTSVLLVRATTYQGRANIRWSIVSLDGKVLRDELIAEGDEGFDHWGQTPHGKLFQGTSILHLTPNGVVKQDLATGSYTPLKETSGIIAAGDYLVRIGKKIGAVRRDGTILTITKKGK